MLVSLKRPPFSNNNTSSTKSPLLSDTYDLFHSFIIGHLPMMEVALALLISLMAMENHCMKISIFSRESGTATSGNS
jgi:phosphohistidine phosphatase SixA